MHNNVLKERGLVKTQINSDPTNIWTEFLAQAFPTDVFLFAGAEEFPEIIAAWQVIMNVLVKESDQKVFTGSTLIVPKARIDISNKIKKATQHLLDQKINSETRKVEIWSEIDLVETSTFESENLLKAIEQVPDGSAVGVLYSPFYRFPDINDQEKERIRTWMGINYRLGTAEDVATPHLIELVKRTIPVAQKKQLFVTFFCEFTSYYSQNFIEEFETNDSVMYAQISWGSENFDELARIQKLVDQTENIDIADAMSQISAISSSSINQAIALSVFHFKRHQFVSAWQTIEPFFISILESENSTLILSIGNTAFAAGRVDEGKRLLAHAVEIGLYTLEDLRHAYILARELHQTDLANEMLNKMSLLYPASRTTLSFIYDKFINERKYVDALGVARQLGDELGVLLCEIFGSEDFDVEGFLEHAKSLNKLEWALLASSIEAIKRNLLELSESLVNRLISEIGFSDQAIKIKVFLWSKKYLGGRELDDSLAMELAPVIEYVAHNPNQLESRFSLQKLFEEDIDETASVVILSYLLLHSIQSSFNQLDLIKLREEWAHQQQQITPSADEIEQRHLQLFEFILETFSDTAIVIGKGEIRPEILSRIDNKFVNWLVHLIQFNAFSADSDYQTLLLMLHVLALACKGINDPTTDFLALHLVIAKFARDDSGQKARDLAENSLLLASNQPDFESWRYGQAWACYADAHERTRNPLSALMMLVLCFYAWNNEFHSRIQLARTYRLATRILRDLGMSSLALEVLDMEKKMISMKGDNELENLELEQVKLSIEIAGLSNQPDVNQLNSFLARSVILLDESIRLDHELTTVLSLQATLFRLFYIANISIASEIKDKFDSLLVGQEIAVAQLLRDVSNPFPEKKDLLSAIQRASQSNHLDDLVHQLQPVVILAENCIQAACRSGDADFFLMASTILSQPGLSIENALSNQKEYNNIRDFSEQAKAWLLSYVRNNYQNYDRQLLEARGLVNQLLLGSDVFFKQIINLSASELSSVLEDNEILVVISNDAAGNLCRLLITSRFIASPEIMPLNIWLKKDFINWKSNFSRNLNKWRPPIEFQEEYPSKQSILSSVAQLSIGALDSNCSLIIAPSSDLSTFPFALSNNYGLHLADSFPLCTTPSVLSLLSSRKNGLTDSRLMKAWLGDPNTFDLTILYVRERLAPIFDAFGVEIVDSAPDGLSEASIAFVMSHGGAGLSESFSGVTDATHFFSPKDFANRISGCGSAVLFVCGGATGEVERSSPEIRGLTRELLMSNTKAVISSPWSLNANIPEIWLPAFLECIREKRSIGEASFIASQSVKKIFDNPCAWASLQLYGDPAFRISG
jgi:hypothetical protein